MAVIIVVYGLVGYLCTCGAPVGKPLSRPRQAVLKAWGIGSARVGLFILGYYYIPVRGKRDVSVAPYEHFAQPASHEPDQPSRVSAPLLPTTSRSWTFLFSWRAASQHLLLRYVDLLALALKTTRGQTDPPRCRLACCKCRSSGDCLGPSSACTCRSTLTRGLHQQRRRL